MQPEEVARLLRDGIREGALAPGQPLVQDDLAKRFSVSRIPIREALRILAAEGMAEARPGGGLAVTSLTSDAVAEMYDLRLSLEPTLAPYIVANASSADIARWKGILAQLKQVEADPRQWTKLNYQFHLALYESSQRVQTVKIIRSLMDLTLPYARFYMAAGADCQALDDEHGDLVSAIEGRDEERFAKVIRSHLQSTRSALVSGLGSAEQAEAQRSWF